MITYSLIAAFGIMLASLAGIVFVQKTAQNFLTKNLQYLLSFAGGVFFIVALGLILESFELLENFVAATGFIITGFLFVELLTRVLPETHHHHDKKGCDHGHSRIKVIIGDALHNVTDGFVLVTAFLISPIVGFAAFVSIFIHEIVQEVSEFVILTASGLTNRMALLVNFLTSSTILIGVGIGFFIADSATTQGILMALSAGVFLHVFAVDLLPHRRLENKSYLGRHIAILLLAIIATAGITFGLGHSHSHGDDHDHNHAAEHDHDDDHGDEVMQMLESVEYVEHIEHDDHHHD